jgi:hypothetical protein
MFCTHPERIKFSLLSENEESAQFKGVSNCSECGTLQLKVTQLTNSYFLERAKSCEIPETVPIGRHVSLRAPLLPLPRPVEDGIC